MTIVDSTALQAAELYDAAKLCVIPVRMDGSKAPAVPWAVYQERRSTPEEHRHWWGNGTIHAIGIVQGQVSGNSETIDFDHSAATIYPAWCEMVESACPGLLDRLSHRRTGGGGYHVGYRCPAVTIPGSTKLAERVLTYESGDEVEIEGKRYRPRKSAGKWTVTVCLIETRGEGGQVIVPGSPAGCHPSGRPYEHHRGVRLSQIQDITPEEREILWSAARSLNERPQPTPSERPARGKASGLLPGSDYNQRGDWQALYDAGWEDAGTCGGVQRVRRPGKAQGWSGTIGHCKSDDGSDLFYCFSSNGAPFDAGKTYSRFAVLALLRHDGDFRAAAKALAAMGYGDQGHRPAKTAGLASAGPSDPSPEPAPPTQTTGYDLILAHFRAVYQPTFRRGNVLYSGSHGREVRPGEACFAPGKVLAAILEQQAADVPRNDQGAAKRNAVPQFFRLWAPSAWKDLLAELPEEHEAAEVSEEAQDHFRAQLTSALTRQVTLGMTDQSGQRPETRPLIDWCRLFGRAGGWDTIRGYRIWTWADAAGLRVALRVELFGQIGSAHLGGMTQRRFSGLCETYGCGSTIKVEGGATRAVELSREVIADMLAGPMRDGETDARTDVGPSPVRAREKHASVRPSEEKTT